MCSEISKYSVNGMYTPHSHSQISLSNVLTLAAGQSSNTYTYVCVVATHNIIQRINLLAHLGMGDFVFPCSAIPLPFAFFGPGTGDIAIDRLDCNGTEGVLTNCDYEADSTFCFHFEDASVLCQCEHC